MSKPSRSRGKDDSTSTLDTLHLIARDLNLTGSAWMGGNLIVTGSISGSSFQGVSATSGVSGLAASGSNLLTGSIYLTGSGGASVSQSGQVITIDSMSVSGGSGSFNALTVTGSGTITGSLSVFGVISGSDYEGSLHMQVQSPSGPWVNVGYTGSDLPIPISGSVDSRQSGSWEVSVSGGSVGITGSGTLNVQGSIGITGSSPLSLNLDGTAVSGSIGITGSATLPVSLIGTSVSGSIGITGSASVEITKDIGKNITGSIGLSITGSSTIATTLVGTAVSGSVGLTGSTQLPTSLTTDGNLKVAVLEGMSGSITSGAMYVSGSVNVSGSVGITSDIGKSITGSIPLGANVSITGSSMTLSVSGSVNVTPTTGISITGSSTIPTTLTGTTVGISGSSVTLPVTGSVDARQSGSWEVSVSGGSIGITGSTTLPVSLVGTAISGSVGITGSEPLVVDSRQSGSWNITGGSVGITGSDILDIELRITGSDIALGVTGSVDARQSGSWNLAGGSIGITGSSELSVNVAKIVGVDITGSIGVSITGSTTLTTTLAGTTIGISGSSATLPVTGSVGLTTGISITGSTTIATTLVGTAVSGSIGITGSATLPVSLVGTAVSGSVGITGSVTEVNLEDADSDNSIGISVAKKSLQSFFESTGSWVESAGADNLATTTTHRGVGSNFLTFDKIAGDTTAMISTTVTAIDMSAYNIHAFGHMHVYLSSLSNIVKIFVRIGTDSSNYHQWDFVVADLAIGWNDLDTPISDPSSQVGVGYNLASITWIAFGVVFSAVGNTLAGIITGGWAIKRAVESYLISQVATEISSPFIAIKDGNGQTKWDIAKGGTYNYGLVGVTDGTNLMPSMDAAARPGYVNVVGGVVSGSVGITGSATLPTSLAGTSISGSVGITGSATLTVQGSVGITGSATLPVSLIGTAISGSIGITGSATLPVSLIGTAVSGSIGITGSAELSANVTKIVGINLTGSMGISITGSTVTVPITGSVNITGSTFFAPISKLNLFNTGSAANTAILATHLVPSNPPCLFTTYACFASGSTFMVLKVSGSTTGSEYLNSGMPLEDSGSYMFDIFVNVGQSVNYMYGTGSTVIDLSVAEKVMI